AAAGEETRGDRAGLGREQRPDPQLAGEGEAPPGLVGPDVGEDPPVGVVAPEESAAPLDAQRREPAVAGLQLVVSPVPFDDQLEEGEELVADRILRAEVAAVRQLRGVAGQPAGDPGGPVQLDVVRGVDAEAAVWLPDDTGLAANADVPVGLLDVLVEVDRAEPLEVATWKAGLLELGIEVEDRSLLLDVPQRGEERPADL